MNLALYLAQHWTPSERQQLHSLPPKQATQTAIQSLLIDFVLRQGGMLQHSILREERIQHVRLFDAQPPIELHTGERTSHIVQWLQTALIHDQRLQLPHPGAEDGDLLAYHALSEYLCSVSAPCLHFQQALLHASPLTRLCKTPALPERIHIKLSSGQSAPPACTPEEYRRLLNHPVFPYLTMHIAEQWSEQLQPHAHRTCQQQSQNIRAQHATLQSFMQACIREKKLSSLRIFVVFFRRLVQDNVQHKMEQILTFTDWKIAEREELVSAYIGLLHLGLQLEQLYQRHIIQPGPYGWDEPLEVKLFLNPYGKLWASGGLSQRIHASYQHVRSQMG